MKQKIFPVFVILISILLAACGTAKETASQTAVGTGAPGQGNGGMSQVMQLAIGTLSLDKTDYPIDAKQAAELLPLWKAARSLNDSDVTAAEETAGLLKQIQNSLTAEQWQAIQEMEVSPQSMAELGLNIGPGRPAGTDSSASGSDPMAGGAPPDMGGGGMPGGGMPSGGGMPGGGPGGGGMPGGGGGFSFGNSDQNSSTSARSLGIDTSLLDAVIKFLQAKIQ